MCKFVTNSTSLNTIFKSSKAPQVTMANYVAPWCYRFGILTRHSSADEYDSSAQPFNPTNQPNQPTQSASSTNQHNIQTSHSNQPVKPTTKPAIQTNQSNQPPNQPSNPAIQTNQSNHPFNPTFKPAIQTNQSNHQPNLTKDKPTSTLRSDQPDPHYHQLIQSSPPPHDHIPRPSQTIHVAYTILHMRDFFHYRLICYFVAKLLDKGMRISLIHIIHESKGKMYDPLSPHHIRPLNGFSAWPDRGYPDQGKPTLQKVHIQQLESRASFPFTDTCPEQGDCAPGKHEVFGEGA